MNPSDPAFPPLDEGLPSGLTKREYFAAMALSGMAANPSATWDYVKGALYAVEFADALIAELSKS